MYKRQKSLNDVKKNALNMTFIPAQIETGNYANFSENTRAI